MSEKNCVIPYIGVCDVGTNENMRRLAEHFTRLSQGGPLGLKAGITMTRKALWGIPTEYKKVCPPKRQIRNIFRGSLSMVMNTIHYPDYDGVDLAPSLEYIVRLGGVHLHAVQLDMIWPDPKILEKCKKAHPDLQFILQVGEKALGEVNNNPLQMWMAVKNYDGIVERILLDRSMGYGKELKARSLVRFVDILYERMKTPGVVVAGKLGPDTIHLVEPLKAMYPMLSIDAQSELHEGGKTLGGPISMPRTMEYLSAAIAMHCKHNVMS